MDNFISRAAGGALLAALVGAALLVLPQAARAVEPHTQGATVLSSTRVKVIFSTPVAASATQLSHYRITYADGSLRVRSARLVNSGYAVTLRTGLQRNARRYTITVRGIVSSDGTAMATAETERFTGTSLGLNSATLVHDDFNRPSGLVKGDTPIPGPWLSKDVNTMNQLGLATSLRLEGAGSLRSAVSDTNPERDNALVRYKIKSGPQYFISGYVYIPSQDWATSQEIGILRLNQFLYSTQARLFSEYDGGASWALKVRWKRALGTWVAPRLVRDGLRFDRWYWLQMKIRNRTATTRGQVTVWLNGRRVFHRLPAAVANVPMTYAEAGVMHLVTQGPSALVHFDQIGVSRSKLPRGR